MTGPPRWRYSTASRLRSCCWISDCPVWTATSWPRKCAAGTRTAGRWPAPAFARAVELVLREEDLTCVLIGTDQEAHETGEVAAYLGSRAVDLTGRTTVGQLGAVLKRCEVVLANDGGVAHLAAAVGTPAVTIFGPSNDRAWRPLLGTVVASDLPCRPCFYVDFRRGLPAGCATRECMSLVTPRMVADAALSLLRERRVAV